MTHTDNCFECWFQECDSCDCIIPEHSGYEDEDSRNFDNNGYDGWLPCKYYTKWEDAINILISHINHEIPSWLKTRLNERIINCNLLAEELMDDKDIEGATTQQFKANLLSWVLSLEGNHD